MWKERNLQVSKETSNIDNKNRHIGLNGDTRDTSTSDDTTRLSISGSQEPIGEGLSSVFTEDRSDLSGMANILERLTLKGATSVPIPNDGVERETKSRHIAGEHLRRGDVANLQKRAEENKRLRGEPLHLRWELA